MRVRVNHFGAVCAPPAQHRVDAFVTTRAPGNHHQRSAAEMSDAKHRHCSMSCPSFTRRSFAVDSAWSWTISTLHLVPKDLRKLYHVHEWRNAAGVLKTACPDEWADIVNILRKFRLLRSEIVTEGGNRSPISRRLDSAFYGRGWHEKDFATAIVVDEQLLASPTHAADCFKDCGALEFYWNT